MTREPRDRADRAHPTRSLSSRTARSPRSGATNPSACTPAARAGSRWRGPKTAAIAILAFFGGSVLAIHLIDAREARSPRVEPSGPPVEPVPPPEARGPAFETPVPSAPPAVPALQVSDERDRELNDCVERNVRGAGYEDVKPTLPGRWPALKRAREERRLRRVAVRAACEQGLAR